MAPYPACCYDPAETWCSGKAQPGTRNLRDAFDDMFEELGDLGIYNCFGAEERILTWDGPVPIGSLVGTTVRVLSHRGRGIRQGSGRWVDAEIRSFGLQPTCELTLERWGVRKKVEVTPDHRWFRWSKRTSTSSRVEEVITTDLRPGERLATLYPQSVATRTSLSPIGVAMGVVFGDGTRSRKDARVALYGTKNQELLRFFPGCAMATYHYEPHADSHVLVTGLPFAWKDLIDPNEATSVLYGWLAGYVAADGDVSQKGSIRLSSTRREHLEHAQLVALRLGIATGSISETKRSVTPPAAEEARESILYSFTFDNRSLDSDFLVLQSHRERWLERQMPARMWNVVSVSEPGEPVPVFCAVVPETETFVLDGFLLTGNCRNTASGGPSTHRQGRSWDCKCSAFNFVQLEVGNFVFALLIEMHSTLGIQRVIWNHKEWDCVEGTIEAYGCDSPGSSKSHHTDHLHIEMCYESARDNPMSVEEIKEAVMKVLKDAVREVLDEEAKEGSAKGFRHKVWKALYKGDKEHLNELDAKLDRIIDKLGA